MTEWIGAIWFAVFRAVYYWFVAIIPAMALAYVVKEIGSAWR